MLAHCLAAHCPGAFQSAKDVGGDGRPLGCGRGRSKGPEQDAQASREPQVACATPRGHLSRADREKTKHVGIYHGLFFFTRRSHANSCPQSARGTRLRAEHTFCVVDPTTACLEPPLENAFSEDSRETSELTQS